MTADGKQVVGALPPPLTSFVGRDHDRAEVGRLVRPGSLVTLTGPGGSGKTRLAVEVARDLAQCDEDVLFVPLASTRDLELVPSTLAVALGIREEPGRTLTDVVIDRLRSRPALLLLDNCEHVLDGLRSLVTRILHDVREVRLIATSREPLRVAGERVWPVAPLAVPDRAAGPDDVESSPAGKLFLDRARQMRPGFALAEDTAAIVAALCRRLGGLPLAIELIAPWTRALAVQEIAARLDELTRLPMSSDGGRHRSIEAALGWSIDLLNDDQRGLFRRLAVFAGGFSLGAAEAVCGREDVLQTLTELVDKGLVMVEPGVSGRTRYWLLEPVRQYATRLLEGSGDEAAARTAHREFFIRFAEDAEEHLHRAEQVEWLSWLDEDHANLRVAYEDAMGADEPEAALRLVGALWWYWWLRGHIQEGIRRLEEALDAAPDAGVLRAKALIGLAGFLLLLGEYERGLGLAEESAALCRHAGDEKGLARALGTLGRIHYNAGELDASERSASEALQLYRELGHDGGIAWMLLVLGGTVGAKGHTERYAAMTEESAALFATRGDRWGLGWTQVVQAGMRLGRGDPATATSLLDRALEGFAECGNRDEAVVVGHAYRAMAGRRLGDLELSQTDAVQALELGLRTADESALSLALGAGADWLAAAGAAEESAQMLGAALARATTMPQVARDLVSTPLRGLRTRLGDAALEEAMRRGGDRPPSDFLKPLRALPVDAASSAAPTPPDRREAVLICEGDYWTARFGDEQARVADLKGFRYLVHLLREPGREFHALDLVAEIEQVPADRIDRGDAGPMLDEQAKAAYRRRLQELESELDEAEAFGDTGRAEHARSERDALARELARAVGLGGRDRHAGSASERARVNITRLIGRAVERVEEAGCASLAHLLRTTVRTGTYCAYEPPPDGGPRWSL